MRASYRLLVGAALGLCGVLFAGAQTDSAGVVVDGCAMPLTGNPAFLTLCEREACSLLRGKVDAGWSGHTVRLRGIVHAATSTQPRTIEVQAVLKIGGACSQRCEPVLPGRGLHGKDKPGPEGGTPGVRPTPPPL